MNHYYELHVTMQADPELRETVRKAVEVRGWRFSAIDGDANLGSGIKLYATRQLSARRWDDQGCVGLLHSMALGMSRVPGVTVVRRKVERVIYDDRSSKVRAACDGACPECHA